MTATLFAKAGPATLFSSWRFVRLTKLGRRLANVNYFFLREQPCELYVMNGTARHANSTYCSCGAWIGHIKYNEYARTI